MKIYIIVTLIEPFLTGPTFMRSLSTYLSLPTYLPVFTYYIYLPIYLSYLSTHLTYLSLSVYLSYLSILYTCLSIFLLLFSCLTFCDPMDCSTPGFPVLHYLPEFAQTHIFWVGDAIQPSHPLSPPSPPALNLPQHQGLFQWVSSLVKLLELQLQHQSYLPILSIHIIIYLPTYLHTFFVYQYNYFPLDLSTDSMTLHPLILQGANPKNILILLHNYDTVFTFEKLNIDTASLSNI